MAYFLASKEVEGNGGKRKISKECFILIFATQNLPGTFWMEVNLHCHFISVISFLFNILLQHITSVTMPSLFLSKAFMKKSEDFRILMKLSFVRFPSSPASRITLIWMIIHVNHPDMDVHYTC